MPWSTIVCHSLVPLPTPKSAVSIIPKWRPPLFVLLFFLFTFKRVVGTDIEFCGRALGMESGRIRDEQLSVSSSFDSLSTGPANARLNSESGSGAWCPQNQINATSHEWIQVELGEEYVITGVRTQGRWDKGRGKEYAQGYMVEYWRESLNRWARYKDAHGNEIIRANSDTQNSILRLLDGAIVARSVRLVPVSESVRTVCLRFELFGCEYKDALLSYSAPSASFADALDLRDSSYDGSATEVKNGSGQLADTLLCGGIGRLFDGTVGEDNFEERPEGWVGWRTDQMWAPFVSIELFFSKTQNFSSFSLHSSNFRRAGAPLFRFVRVLFAPIGDTFSSRIVQFDVPPDFLAESARWIRVPIPHRIGTKVRLELHFGNAAKWLLISEIRTESEDVSNGAKTILEGQNSNLTPKIETFEIGQSAEGNGDEKQRQRTTNGTDCLLIVAFVCAFVLGCALLCLCFFLLFRPSPPPPGLKRRSAHSSASFASLSSSSDNSNSLLHQLLLKKAQRKIENSKKPRNSKKVAVPEVQLGEDGKELMDIAKLVIEQNVKRALISGGKASEEDNGQYADPEEPTQFDIEKRPLASSSACPSHFLFTGEATRRAKLRHFPSSEYSIASFVGNESVHSAVDPSRYRRTPIMCQFSPLPPPLPSMPPPSRRNQ
ncbi:hypothetical protein niasHS_014774 [Heterodera schachtii]|uniref:F5/8 type C domain-containing protein n=1 Tax=Heterodera schachtii TaxID=97005 RepID=A0ABD2ILQ3_HETSC